MTVTVNIYKMFGWKKILKVEEAFWTHNIDYADCPQILSVHFAATVSSPSPKLTLGAGVVQLQHTKLRLGSVQSLATKIEYMMTMCDTSYHSPQVTDILLCNVALYKCHKI